MGRILRRVQVALDRALGSLPPRVIRWFAREDDSAVTTGRLLVLVPHPDDETIGAGMAIPRTLDAGGQVTIVVGTDGRHGDPDTVPPEQMGVVRRDELERATAALGVPPADLVILEFEDASLTRNELRLAEAIADIVEAKRPDVVIAPSPWDLHPDHAALGRAARQVLAGRSIRHLEYLVWGWDAPVRLTARLVRRASQNRIHWGYPGRPVLLDGTGYVDRKAEALACYSSQFSPTAVFRGRPVGGSGPLGHQFMRRIDFANEVFFLRRPTPSPH